METKGGLNILVRHGATNSNRADTDWFHLAEISKQRYLSDKGKELARAFETRSVGIPGGVFIVPTVEIGLGP